MSELISGKEALIALANGEKVELQALGDMNWYDSTQWTVGELLCFKGKFRLKPHTITINGIEVPAPFEPKVGEKYWFIADYTSCGYSDTQEGTGINSSIGKWRTEDEIKQVVAALRSIFNKNQEMVMQNLKIKVNNEAESREVQGLLLKLGYKDRKN